MISALANRQSNPNLLLCFVITTLLLAADRRSSVCSVNAFTATTTTSSSTIHRSIFSFPLYKGSYEGGRISDINTGSSSRRSPSSFSVVALHAAHPHQIDLDVQFGSSNETGVTWGGDDNDPEEDDDFEDEETRERAIRQQKIDFILQQQDVEFREERKQKQWGKFANITSKEELEPILLAERKKIDKENQIKKRHRCTEWCHN